MSGVRLREKDSGADALLKRMADAARKHGLRIGVSEEKAQRVGGGVTNFDVAAFAEFGTATTEPRPWLSGWYDEAEARNRTALRKIGEQLVKGTLTSVVVGLDGVGIVGSEEIKRRIRSGIAPPNSEATLAKKSGSTPLIDSEQFVNSIAHKLER